MPTAKRWPHPHAYISLFHVFSPLFFSLSHTFAFRIVTCCGSTLIFIFQINACDASRKNTFAFDCAVSKFKIQNNKYMCCSSGGSRQKLEAVTKDAWKNHLTIVFHTHTHSERSVRMDWGGMEKIKRTTRKREAKKEIKKKNSCGNIIPTTQPIPLK